jgi:transcriptional regulator with PAS, ATPase and Fis domain
MKRLVLISGSEATRRALASQVEELFDNGLAFDSFALDNGLDHTIRNALVVLASVQIQAECREYLDASCEVIIAKRTLNFAHLDKLYSMPASSSLLVVNGSQRTANEVVELLKKIGFVNYSFETYFPGSDLAATSYDFIITPGETNLIPVKNATILDIGPRVMDITTIIEIVQSLGMFDPRVQERIYLISAKYMGKIIALGKALSCKNDFLLSVFNSVTDGMIAYNKDGTIELINDLASKLLDLNEMDNIFEKSAGNLSAFLNTGASGNFMLQVDHSTYLLSKVANGADDACLVTIKNIRERINMEHQLKHELKKQGYRAKYTFSDLVHKSRIMKDVVSKGKKLAACEFSILIYGESGTGKEIFASALHNASKRHKGPFMAVNFSALPDELIESELFGYEDGAFTGARKGGKIGLFELADQGTIFLDEIGDISLKIQSRLLRVLQEKEVLKVGGTKNIPVDVRVVAATNKDLSDMVRKGQFREDLYYRLKKLYVHLPPLRERREDIMPLFNHFLIKKNGYHLQLTDEARALLNAYEWPGNVRELESNVEYILAVCEGERIEPSSLSEDLLKNIPIVHGPDDGKVMFILKAIRKFNEENRMIGRKKLSELTWESQCHLSEDQIRRLLGELSTQGLVQMSRGRIGLKLTNAGMAYFAGPEPAVGNYYRVPEIP